MGTKLDILYIIIIFVVVAVTMWFGVSFGYYIGGLLR